MMYAIGFIYAVGDERWSAYDRLMQIRVKTSKGENRVSKNIGHIRPKFSKFAVFVFSFVGSRLTAFGYKN